MKRKADPRHQLRVKIMKQLFEKNFRESLELSKPSDALEIYYDRKKIYKIITTNAPAWPLNQIPPVDLATLRLAIWELKFKRKKEPYKVVIYEAVEIAKEFGTGASPSFINGVLGSVVKKEIIHKQFGISEEKIEEESYFDSDLNITELEIEDLVANIQEKYSITIPDEKLPSIKKISDLIAYIYENADSAN